MKYAMVDEIPRLMNEKRNKSIMIKLRNNRMIRGRLKEFDVHMNMTIDDTEDVTDEAPSLIGYVLLRGDNIIAISFPE